MMAFELILGAWIASALTLFIMSFLYKDNPLYKLAEHVFVGWTLGYAIIVAWFDVLYPDFWKPLTLKGEAKLLIPAAIGMMTWARLVPKWAWISRWAFAFIIGYGAGVAIPTAIEGFVMKQVSESVSPILQTDPQGRIQFGFANVFAMFSELLVVVILVCVLLYFFFSVEHKGPVRIAARGGMLFLMAAFGIWYGNSVMGRVSLMYGRMDELVENSKSAYWFASPIVLLITIGLLALWEFLQIKKGPAERKE